MQVTTGGHATALTKREYLSVTPTSLLAPISSPIWMEPIVGRAAEQRDEIAPSYVEHRASPPLRALGASNDHQLAGGPCSRFAAGSGYHGGWDRILGTDLNCSESR
jgi:hypothetical protein